MQDIAKPMQERVEAYNDAFDTLVDQFIGKDAAGRSNRGSFISQLRRAKDPTKIPRFDEVVEYVRNHPEIEAQLSGGMGESTGQADIENLVFESLKAGKALDVKLNSDSVWDEALKYLESFGGPVKQYEISDVEFSMKFWKEVIRPDTYYHGGQKTTIAPARINHWYDQAAAMLKRGVQIPVPYFHTDDAKPVIREEIKDDVRDTAAYIEDVKVKDGGLWALFDPVDEKAEKEINNKIRHVSIRTGDFKDGKGQTYKDAITHIAACHNGVMQDQKPFVPEHGLALSLSMAHDPASNDEAPSLALALNLLADLGYELGGDTNPDNFIDRLCTALRVVKSYKETEETGEEYGQMPEGAKAQKPAPIAMSQTALQFAIATLSESPNNPATNKAWTEDELTAAYEAKKASEPKLEFSAAQKAALASVQTMAKNDIVSRIKACVSRGAMTAETAKACDDVLETVELQFSIDGQVDQTDPAVMGVYDALRIAEASNSGAAMTGQKNVGGRLRFSVEDLPADNNPEMTPEDHEKEAQAFMERTHLV